MKKTVFVMIIIGVLVMVIMILVGKIQDLDDQIAELNSKNSELAQTVDFYENGASNMIVQIRLYREKDQRDKVLEAARELHEKFAGTQEDIEAQGYVEEIQEERRKERQRAKELEKVIEDKNQSDKQDFSANVTDIISVSKPTISIDYVGGSTVKINFTNKADEAIKYITFNCTPYNAVGDRIECQRDIGKSSAALKGTGPYEPGSNQTLQWYPVWYNSTLSEVRIDSIDIEYMSGTKEMVSRAEIDLVVS